MAHWILIFCLFTFFLGGGGGGGWGGVWAIFQSYVVGRSAAYENKALLSLILQPCLDHHATLAGEALRDDKKQLQRKLFRLPMRDFSLVDFIRTFTWDKKLEMYVKASGILGGQGRMPTVVSPELYRTRFTEAMHRYFLMVPDKWTGLGNDLD